MIINALLSFIIITSTQIVSFNKPNICSNSTYRDVVLNLDNTANNYFNDPGYSNQWHIISIDLDKAWKVYKPKKTIKIAFFDSKFYLNDDIKEFINKDKSISFIDSIKEPFYTNNIKNGFIEHGSFATSITCAKQNNDFGISGILNNAEIYCYSVIDENGRFPFVGTKQVYTSLIKAINHCKENNIDIINMSLHFNNYDEDVKNAINDFNGLIICSSGNNGEEIDGIINKSYPSNYGLDNVISIGATDINKNVWEESNYSSTYVDLFAPGVNITSLSLNKIQEADGTSFSTPIVTGIAAMYLSMYPNVSIKEVKDRILNSPSTISSKLLKMCKSGGIVNALNAIHDHNYSYTYLSTLKHKYLCECLDKEVEAAHIVAGGSFDNGKRYASCLHCGGLAEMGFVLNTISLNNNNYYFEYIDGLYYINKTQYIDGVLNLSYKYYISGDY